MKHAAVLAAAALCLVACAAQSPTGDEAQERRYTTGSNLPLRDRGVQVMTPEQVEAQRNSSSGTMIRRPAGN